MLNGNWVTTGFVATLCGVAFCLGMCAAQLPAVSSRPDADVFASFRIEAERYTCEEGCVIYRLSRGSRYVGWLASDGSGWNAAHLYPRWHYAKPVLSLPQALKSIGLETTP